MKKIKKIRLTEHLHSKELKYLKGGANKNKNTTSGCICTYYDGPSVWNVNKEGSCSCECVY